MEDDEDPTGQAFGAVQPIPPALAAEGFEAAAGAGADEPWDEISWNASIEARTGKIVMTAEFTSLAPEARMETVMARFSDLSLKNQLYMRTYRYRRLDPVPFAPLAEPLSECRVALVTTGGVYQKDQPAFDDEFKGGDFSYRLIGNGIDVATLGIAHKSDAFDQSGFLADRNLGFPLDRFRELLATGEIGELNARHLSFMGSITAPGRLMKETAPEAAELLVADRVDLAFLVPL